MIEITQEEINLLILIMIFLAAFIIGSKFIDKRQLDNDYKKGSLNHSGEPFIIQSNKDDFIKKIEQFKF